MNISDFEFENCMKDVSFPLAVAVSGGPDSLALLFLAHDFAQRKNERLIALTVDHGLRPESKEEALKVQAWATEKGIEHVILEWHGKKPQSRLQERARSARYTLLTSWCKENGVEHLLLGHHAHDQEETFWMRLSSGSGLDGLSGMKKKVLKDGITLHRPLLEASKENIKETLAAQNHQWIEDPSNHSKKFLRGRLRNSLKDEGLSSKRLQIVMNKLREDADFIQENLEYFLRTHVKVHEGGYLTLSKKAFEELHPALAKRVISFLMGWFKSPSYPPRYKQVSIVCEKIILGKSFTAGGIYWVLKQDVIHLFREFSAIKESLSLADLNKRTLWDNRFWIDQAILENVSRETFLAPLGPRNDNYCIDIPPQALPSLPALWEKGNVVAIFPLCYNNKRWDMDLRKKIFVKTLFHDSLIITI